MFTIRMTLDVNGRIFQTAGRIPQDVLDALHTPEETMAKGVAELAQRIVQEATHEILRPAVERRKNMTQEEFLRSHVHASYEIYDLLKKAQARKHEEG